MADTLTKSPLASPDIDGSSAIQHVFSVNPKTLSDAELTVLIVESRRRRNAVAAEEAAKASKPKAEKAPKLTAAAKSDPALAEVREKAKTGSISLDDIGL